MKRVLDSSVGFKWIVPELHRQVDGNVAREPNGRVTGKFIFEVPLAAADGLVNKIKRIGIVRVQRSSRNTQVPDSALAVARLEVALSNQEPDRPQRRGPLDPDAQGSVQQPGGHLLELILAVGSLQTVLNNRAGFGCTLARRASEALACAAG